MDWVKLLTEFEGHPKVLAAGNAGAGVYARSLAYCGKYETDGYVPKEWADQAVAREGQHDLPGRLVDQGLWGETDSGYLIRDFTEVNRSHEEMNDLRETRSNAGKRGGQAKAKAKRKQKRSKSPSYSSSDSSSFSFSEFEDWLSHYRETTGKTKVEGSQPARDAFAARRKDGYSVEDLKLATVGCHGDDFCRDHGHDVPETILRASKVTRYIELGRKPKSADPLTRDLERLEAEKQRLRAEEARA